MPARSLGTSKRVRPDPLLSRANTNRYWLYCAQDTRHFCPLNCRVVLSTTVCTSAQSWRDEVSATAQARRVLPIAMLAQTALCAAFPWVARKCPHKIRLSINGSRRPAAPSFSISSMASCRPKNPPSSSGRPRPSQPISANCAQRSGEKPLPVSSPAVRSRNRSAASKKRRRSSSASCESFIGLVDSMRLIVPAPVWPIGCAGFRWSLRQS